MVVKTTPGPVFGRRDPDPRGYFGEFGGRFIPETLVAPVEALEAVYFEARQDPAFIDDLRSLLENYVGRPTPLQEARRLAEGSGFDSEAWNLVHLSRVIDEIYGRQQGERVLAPVTSALESNRTEEPDRVGA